MDDSVPTINITSDQEEDDDHHILAMGEVATDVEDLEEPSQPIRKIKKKLLIRVNDDLGGNTDIEDIPGSDSSEECPVIIGHKRTFANFNFNLDTGIIEETCKINDKNEKTNFKVHSQKSLTPLTQKSQTEFTKEDILTDIENMSGDDSESSSTIPELELNPEIFEANNDICTKDDVKYSLVATPSPCATPMHYLSENETNKPKESSKMSSMRLTVSMFQFPNVTDIELLESDVENGEQIAKKTKKIKKRRSKPKNQKDPQSNKYLNTERLQHGKENEGTTDIEEFEADTNVVTEYIYDNSAMNKEIEKMQSLYGPTKEKHSYKRTRGKSTDFSQLSDDSDHCNRRAIKPRSYKKENRQLCQARRNLRCPETSTACLTDVENILSSDNEKDSEEELIISKPRRMKDDPGDLTEEEMILDGDDYLSNLPDIKLPEAKREVMLIRENDTETPTVIITPLVEDIPLGLTVSEAELTDVENMSGHESDFEEIHENRNNPDNPSIKLEEFENGATEEREFLKTSKQSLSVRSTRIDPGTDTEEITLNIENKNKKITLLNVERQEKSGLTDTEDLYFSDGDNQSSKVKFKKNYGGDSDDEIIESKPKIVPTDSADNDSDYSNTKCQTNNIINSEFSDSDAPEYNDISRSETSTPGNLRQELDDVLASKLKHKKVNYSSEEVMYLKGGSYEIPSDPEISLENKFFEEGWNAPEGQSKDKPVEAVAKQGAALQGESYVSQERTEQQQPVQTTPQPLARAEAEESASQRQTEDRPVADQHMLSDEMKRLLKELEDESKK